eukprot:TRINITY_DN38469_c0_g1_i1.p1 TRINITY_DN38469_c0_g1~~TRINITY_DN38469_c0_g1_i1.p1  ORF type:complete len:485 (+),score=91.76 TRINITY_DN38469_c0_g1_i1:142-1455(+)
MTASFSAWADHMLSGLPETVEAALLEQIRAGAAPAELAEATRCVQSMDAALLQLLYHAWPFRLLQSISAAVRGPSATACQMHPEIGKGGKGKGGAPGCKNDTPSVFTHPKLDDPIVMGHRLNVWRAAQEEALEACGCAPQHSAWGLFEGLMRVRRICPEIPIPELESPGVLDQPLVDGGVLTSREVPFAHLVALVHPEKEQVTLEAALHYAMVSPLEEDNVEKLRRHALCYCVLDIVRFPPWLWIWVSRRHCDGQDSRWSDAVLDIPLQLDLAQFAADPQQLRESRKDFEQERYCRRDALRQRREAREAGTAPPPAPAGDELRRWEVARPLRHHGPNTTGIYALCGVATCLQETARAPVTIANPRHLKDDVQCRAYILAGGGQWVCCIGDEITRCSERAVLELGAPGRHTVQLLLYRPISETGLPAGLPSLSMPPDA